MHLYLHVLVQMQAQAQVCVQVLLEVQEGLHNIFWLKPEHSERDCQCAQIISESHHKLSANQKKIIPEPLV